MMFRYEMSMFMFMHMYMYVFSMDRFAVPSEAECNGLQFAGRYP